MYVATSLPASTAPHAHLYSSGLLHRHWGNRVHRNGKVARVTALAMWTLRPAVTSPVTIRVVMLTTIPFQCSFPGASEATLKDMGKRVKSTMGQNTTNTLTSRLEPNSISGSRSYFDILCISFGPHFHARHDTVPGHDDQIEPFSASFHKGQCRGALMFSMKCPWTIGWANSRDAGDLRRHGGNITVMAVAFRRASEITVSSGQVYDGIRVIV